MKTGMESKGIRDDGWYSSGNDKGKEKRIFNLIIFEDEKKILFYNLKYKKIYLIISGKGLKEISFKEAIREIDIIPQKNQDWKKFQILNLAKDLGFFGING